MSARLAAAWVRAAPGRDSARAALLGAVGRARAHAMAPPAGDEGAPGAGQPWGAAGLSTAPVPGPAVPLCVAAGPGDSRRRPQVDRGPPRPSGTADHRQRRGVRKRL